MNINFDRVKVGYTRTCLGPIKCKLCKRGFLRLSDLQKHKVKHYRLGLYHAQFNRGKVAGYQSPIPLPMVEEPYINMVNKVNDNNTLNSIRSPLQKDSGIDDCSPLSYEGYCEQGKSSKSALPTVYPPCPQTTENKEITSMQHSLSKDGIIDLTADLEDDPGKRNEMMVDYTCFLVKNLNDNQNSNDNDCLTCGEKHHEEDKRCITPTEIVMRGEKPTFHPNKKEKKLENYTEVKSHQCSERANGQCKAEMTVLPRKEIWPLSVVDDSDVIEDVNSSHEDMIVEGTVKMHPDKSETVSNFSEAKENNDKITNSEVCSNSEVLLVQKNTDESSEDTMDELPSVDVENVTDISVKDQALVADVSETVVNIEDKTLFEAEDGTDISSEKGEACTSPENNVGKKVGTNKVIESLFDFFSAKINMNKKVNSILPLNNFSEKITTQNGNCDSSLKSTKTPIKECSSRNIFDLLAQETIPAACVNRENIMDTSETITVPLCESEALLPHAEDEVEGKDNQRLSGGNDFESATGESQFNFYDSNEIVTITDKVYDVMYSDCYLGDIGQFSSQNPNSSSQGGQSDSDDYSRGAGDTPSKYVTLSQDTNMTTQTPMRDMIPLESDVDSTPTKTAANGADFQCEFAKFLQTSSQKKRINSAKTLHSKKSSSSDLETEKGIFDISKDAPHCNIPKNFITSSQSHMMSSRQEKSLLTSHQKLVSLRKKVCKLVHYVFPHIEYPKYFKTNSCCVEALLDQISSLIKSSDGSKCQKIQAIPTEDSCCEVTVVLCKNPRICIKNLRRKIIRFLKNLLPQLELSPNFDVGGEMVDELLKKVIMFNDPSKRIQKHYHKT